LIVRDESAFIEGCLESLAGVVDEIVVVDTGSTDDTIDKARRFPIKLHKFEWSGDFSAARNFALEQASGEWILYIDADERLDAPDPAMWRDVVADATKVAWLLRFYLRVDWTACSELRFFRNDKRIRFRGVIHERVHDDVKTVCASDGLEIGTCGITLRHFGYERVQPHKIARNVPLLRDYLKKSPARVYCWWHLGEMLSFAGDFDGAAEAWRKGIEAARAQGAGGPITNGMPFLSLILLERNRGREVDDLVEEAVRLFPDHLALRWLACKHAVEKGDAESARADLEALAAIDAETFSQPQLSYAKRLFTHAARESLALCHFRAGRYREAADWYRKAAEAAPDPRACEIRAQLAEVKAGSGRAA
jgi:tetratricopeptide (TPR) repeat protein